MAFDVHADVREEVTNFWKGKKPYRIHDGQATTREAVQLFLERNYVVRIPEEGHFHITRDGERILVDGELFGQGTDVFNWQQSVSLTWDTCARDAGRLASNVVVHEKAKAVLAFLMQEQEAEKAREMAEEQKHEAVRAMRLNELAHEYFNRDYSYLTGPKSRRVLERIVELEEQVAAKS